VRVGRLRARQRCITFKHVAMHKPGP
jgi:hypothetical protein